MKKLLCTYLLLVLASNTLAEEIRSSVILFDYECKQVNTEQSWFKCTFDKKTGIMSFDILKEKSTFSDAERERNNYFLHKITRRGLELGHNLFIMTNRKEKRYQACWFKKYSKSKTALTLGCRDKIHCNNLDDGKYCRLVLN